MAWQVPRGAVPLDSLPTSLLSETKPLEGFVPGGPSRGRSRAPVDRTMTQAKIAQLEEEIGKLTTELRALQAAIPPVEVPDYEFSTLEGTVRLSDLFGEHDSLIAIHNMGKGCRYCTLWADGLNAFVGHLESAVALVLLSKDAPRDQRQIAIDRGWQMRMASHGGGRYMQEQAACGRHENMPGAVCYQRMGDKIVRKATTLFGPTDLYCSMWHFLGLAGIDLNQWTPQFSYWKRPQQLEDGGANVVD